jgi:hypothetical protein
MRYLDDFMSGNDDNMSFQCKDGSYSTTKENCEKYGGGVADPVDGYGYTPEPKLPEPTSQADCPDGTTFSPSYISYAPTGIGAARIPAECKEPKISQPKSCEQQYLDYLDFIKREGPRIRIMQKTKEQFMAECEGKSAAPTVEPKMMGMSANWLVPAILIGVGVYVLTRKSE